MENKKWLNFLSLNIKSHVLKVSDGKHRISQVCNMMQVSQPALNHWRQQFLAERQGIAPKPLRFLLNNRKFNICGRRTNSYVAIMPDTIRASDITYIPTDEGWLYLAIVIDWRRLHSALGNHSPMQFEMDSFRI